ncbi:unnamed protein product [Mytilus coruscus]|uniref:Uncharacterized protein n=1 Tax=Mytilus coruscus TaxID=42192 RepID=A0A6J8ECK8_MYTCO|nr:unnamed protein product [Mytilus coruscus]
MTVSDLNLATCVSIAYENIQHDFLQAPDNCTVPIYRYNQRDHCPVSQRSLSSKPGSYDYTTFSGLGRRREELPTHYTVVHDPPSKRKEFKGTHINPLSKGDQSPDETAKLEEPLL